MSLAKSVAHEAGVCLEPRKPLIVSSNENRGLARARFQAGKQAYRFNWYRPGFQQPELSSLDKSVLELKEGRMMKDTLGLSGQSSGACGLEYTAEV